MATAMAAVVVAYQAGVEDGRELQSVTAAMLRGE